MSDIHLELNVRSKFTQCAESETYIAFGDPVAAQIRRPVDRDNLRVSSTAWLQRACWPTEST